MKMGVKAWSRKTGVITKKTSVLAWLAKNYGVKAWFRNWHDGVIAHKVMAWRRDFPKISAWRRENKNLESLKACLCPPHASQLSLLKFQNFHHPWRCKGRKTSVQFQNFLKPSIHYEEDDTIWCMTLNNVGQWPSFTQYFKRKRKMLDKRMLARKESGEMKNLSFYDFLDSWWSKGREIFSGLLRSIKLS